MKVLRLSDKRADENFRAGKNYGHEVCVPSKNVLIHGYSYVWLEKDESRFNVYRGLNPEAKKFLRENGVFTLNIRETREGSLAMFRLSRADAAIMFKLKFS
jgi:hypothetical protein